MTITILTAIAVYVATAIDYLIILIILFSQVHDKDRMKHIISGQYLGTAIILLVSLLAALGTILVPEQWMVGLLGLLPIYLGFKVLISDEDTEESDIISHLSSGRFTHLFVTVTFIVLASSADDFAVYVPYFTTLNVSELFVVFIIFFIMVGILCYISYRLANIRFISEKIELYERWIVPVVFIGLGVYIMLENGVFSILASLF